MHVLAYSTPETKLQMLTDNINWVTCIFEGKKKSEAKE